MRTLHFGILVADLDRSIAFYTAVGYEILGTVPETPFGSLTLIKLPGDEFVTIELVHDPERTDFGSGLNHFVIKVESLDATIADLATRGVEAEPPQGSAGTVLTAWLTDPDGNRIELVQWPAGHPDGITADG